MKIKILLLCLLCAVISLFLTNNPKSIADDSCSSSEQGTSTLAGNIEGLEGYHPQCSGGTPTIVASSDEISSGTEGAITLHVASDSLAKPPYTWTAGNGYTFSPNQTNSNLEETTMTSASGTCGTDYDVYTTVTVTDACGVTDTVVIRNSAGEWQFDSNVCGSGGSTQRWGTPIGESRYAYYFTTPGAGGCTLDCDQSPQSDCWNSVLNSKASYGFPYDPGGGIYSDICCRPDPTYTFAQVGYGKAGSFLIYADIWCGTAPVCNVADPAFRLDKFSWGCP